MIMKDDQVKAWVNKFLDEVGWNVVQAGDRCSDTAAEKNTIN